MKKIISYIVPALAVAFGTLSCDNPILIPDNAEEYRNIFMKQAVSTPNSSTLFITDEEQKIFFNACIGGYGANTDDITVQFAVMPELVEEYNAANLTNYELLDAGSYTIAEGAMTAVIKKGELNSSMLELGLFTEGYMLPGKSYLLPIGISEVEGSELPLNESLTTTYFLFNGAYPLGEEPPVKVFDGSASTPVTPFTYGNYLTFISANNNRVYWFAYNSAAGTFNQAETGSDGDWGVLFNRVMPVPGGWVARWTDGRLQTYTVTQTIGLAFYATYADRNYNDFDLMTTSMYHSALIGRQAGGELSLMTFDFAGNGVGAPVSLGTGWDEYIMIEGYRNGLLAVDSAGDMWFCTIDTAGTVGVKQLVGKGWNKYTRLVEFGERLIGVDARGTMWRYNFDIRAVWDITE